MLFTRLLPLLLLLSVSSRGLSQDVETQSVPKTCPVTRPSEHPFVPPKPYQTGPGIDWFGTDKLWTYLPRNGISGQGEKTLWFREEWSHYRGLDIPDESVLKLSITARRLDADTPPPKISAGPVFNSEWNAFMLGGINLPTPGCWEITGRYEDAEVQFVEWVMSDEAMEQAAPLSIVVDKSCQIEPESDPLVRGDHVDAFRDDAICHLESVLSSRHIEEKITNGQRSRFNVRVAEQEYIVQNPTDKPVVFIVRHEVPEDWIVDSDPHPCCMDGSTAVFRLNAEPGQRVRLHVGMHRSESID